MTDLQQARLIKQAHALLDELELIIHAMFEAADSVDVDSVEQKEAA